MDPKWFQFLAGAFGTLNLVGSIAAIGSHVLWIRQVSDEAPSSGFVIRALVYALIGILAAFSALRINKAFHVARVAWWTCILIAVVDWGWELAVIGSSANSIADLALLGLVAGSSMLLLRKVRPPSLQDMHGRHSR